MRRAVAIMISALLVAGCVAGGANDEPTAPRRDGGFDDVEEELDEGIVEDAEEDTAIDEDAEPDAEDDTAPSDSAPPDVPGADTKPPPDAGCTPSCTSCGGDNGCGAKCLTGACGGAGQVCVAGTCVSPTRSFLSPGDYAFGTAWARPVTWTVGSEAPASIVYTLDGSAPGAGSTSKSAPASFASLANGTTLRWFADNGAKEVTQSITATVATAGQTAYGWIVEKTTFSGGNGPVIVAAPNATVSGTASVQAWNDTGCPGCRHQVVYGIDSTSAGCLYDWSPGPWPGESKTAVAFSVKAPAAPGVYPLNASWTLELSCADGMARNPLNARATARIGVIIVK